MKAMDSCGYLLLKPNELRKKYTEFVLFNKARALLPSRKKGIQKVEGRADRSLHSESQNKSIEESLTVRESKRGGKIRGLESHNEYSDSVTPGMMSDRRQPSHKAKASVSKQWESPAVDLSSTRRKNELFLDRFALQKDSSLGAMEEQSIEPVMLLT